MTANFLRLGMPGPSLTYAASLLNRVESKHHNDPTLIMVDNLAYVQARNKEGQLLWTRDEMGRIEPLLKNVTQQAVSRSHPPKKEQPSRKEALEMAEKQAAYWLERNEVSIVKSFNAGIHAAMAENPDHSFPVPFQTIYQGDGDSQNVFVSFLVSRFK